jgi:hypothetical protein
MFNARPVAFNTRRTSKPEEFVDEVIGVDVTVVECVAEGDWRR